MKKELTWSEMEQRRRMKDLYTGFFVITILVWVFRFLFSLISGWLPDVGFYGNTALQIVFEAAAVLFPFCAYRKISRDPFRDLFRSSDRAERPFLRTLLALVAVVSLTASGTLGMFGLIDILDMNFGVHTAVSLPSIGQTFPEFLFYLILSSVVFGFACEFAFRGIACSAMGPENQICAVLVSSLCFAFGDGNPYHILIRLLISFPLAFLYLRVGSLIPCMILQAVSQAVFVSLISYLSFLNDSRPFCLLVTDVAEPKPVFAPYVGIYVGIGLIVGIAATVALLYPRRNPVPESAPARLGLKMIFSSFGVYALTALLCFSLLLGTFSTDADPSDPLLQPTPEEGQHPDFGRKEPLQFYPPDSDTDLLE